MSILEQMQEEGDFTDTEKNIIQYILSNPSSLKEGTIGTIAKNTYSSNATIVRLCKKPGFQYILYALIYRDFTNFFRFPLHGIIQAIFENAKNGRKKTGNLFLISCLGVPICMYGGYSVFSWLQTGIYVYIFFLYEYKKCNQNSIDN